MPPGAALAWGVRVLRSASVVALVSSLLCASGALVAPELGAAPERVGVEGYVVELQDGDIVVDVAASDGASDGDVIELWRPVKLRHPVTGRKVNDRFLIGRLKLAQVRSELALAQPEGKLDRPAQVGDVVVLRRTVERKAEAPPKPSVKPAAKAPAPAAEIASAAPAVTVVRPEVAAEDADAHSVSQLFDGLAGARPSRRVVAYERYAQRNPNSRYTKVLWEEAAELRRLLALEAGLTYAAPRSVSFSPPENALSGTPLEIGIELDERATGAVLHARRSGEVAYVSTPMTQSGPGYFVVRIPGERMQGRRVEYFIEAVNDEGKAFPVVGGAPDPQGIRVHDVPQPTEPPPHEITASAWSDYADWNRSRGNDRIWQTEGYVGVRLQEVGVRAVRTGFGVYRGVGGSLEELDELNVAPRKVGLTYGYLEGEWGFTPRASLITRGLIGLRDDGISGGALALIRIGSDKKTNLSMGGEVLGGIGVRGITQLELAVFERVPIMFRTEVTNQPAGVAAPPADPSTPPPAQPQSSEAAEIGARAIAQVGYELIDGLLIAARGSYQGRTIRHAGPGFGGAVSYTW
jgi:hypothetical protein